MLVKEVQQTLQIEKGRFHASEAYDVLHGLFKEQINFNKIQSLRAWEKQHSGDTSHWDKKIEHIKAEMKHADQLIAAAKKEGLNLEITCNIEIKFVPPTMAALPFDPQDN